ncbi:hypothetical protein [Promicromonospora soli]
MRRTSAAAIIAAGMLLSSLAAPPASAAPGDPAPGWPNVRKDVMHRDVDISGSGRVFDVGLPDPNIVDQAVLEHGVGEDWSSIEIPPRSRGGMVAGPGDYAMAVTGNVSRVFDGTGWGDPVAIAQEIWESKLVGNTDGDAALLWNGGSGLPYLSRLSPGGAWETIRVEKAPAGVPRDLVINDNGKVTVVWAVPTGETSSEIRRAFIRAGSTTWSDALRVGTVNTRKPNLTFATDGQGRETLIAGNKLWRQASSAAGPRFQFRTSVRAKLATGDTATRLIWAVKSDGRYEIHTRYADPEWRGEKVLWSVGAPLEPNCDRGIEFGVGMVPGGRSYVAAALRTEFGETTDTDCAEVASFLAVSRFDTVLGRGSFNYADGGPFQIEAGARGPVVLEYLPEPDPDYFYGPWRMEFFSR